MSKLNCIKEAIHPSCEITGLERKVLEEPNVMKIYIKSKWQYLIYNFENIKNGDIYPFFNNINGLKIIADYVIISQKKEELYIIIIELKKGRKNPKKQIFATKRLMEFILKRIEDITKQKFAIKYRFIGVSKITCKTTNKIYNKNNYTDFSGTTLNLDIYNQ